jgi:hypothetical protein
MVDRNIQRSVALRASPSLAATAFSPCTLGDLACGWFFTPKGENDMVARQILSSAGIAVFIGQNADKAHWVDVDRCYLRTPMPAEASAAAQAVPMCACSTCWAVLAPVRRTP